MNAPPLPRDRTVDAATWQRIEAGVAQLARLLEHLAADLYTTQSVLAHGLLSPADVLGHPGFLRALHGVAPPGGRWLRLLGVDLAQQPDGAWCVTALHTQHPCHADPLHGPGMAAVCSAWLAGLQPYLPTARRDHIALLTPGPYNAAYGDHAHLAQQLGLSLVEGSDLVVLNQRLYLQTLHGLEPVHALLSLVDDAYLDPLELRADSTLGVPGLLQVIRAGHLLVANMPGVGWLQSPALQNSLPDLAALLMDDTLALPVAAVPHASALRVVAVADGAQGWKALTHPAPNAPGTPHRPAATRRAGENLYWLGRYTERANNTVRLAAAILHAHTHAAGDAAALWTWFGRMATRNSLLLSRGGAPGALTPDPASLVGALIDNLGSTNGAPSVGFCLRAMRLAGAAVRERLTQGHWDLLVQTESDFHRDSAALHQGDPSCIEAAQACLIKTLDALALLAQTQTETMDRDEAWQLMGVGRAIERLEFLSHALLDALDTQCTHEALGLTAVAGLFGAAHQCTTLAALVQDGVADTQRPRSLAALAQGLAVAVARLSRRPSLPDPHPWLHAYSSASGQGSGSPDWALAGLLRQYTQFAAALGSAIVAQHFNHAAFSEPRVGA